MIIDVEEDSFYGPRGGKWKRARVHKTTSHKEEVKKEQVEEDRIIDPYRRGRG